MPKHDTFKLKRVTQRELEQQEAERLDKLRETEAELRAASEGFANWDDELHQQNPKHQNIAGGVEGYESRADFEERMTRNAEKQADLEKRAVQEAQAASERETGEYLLTKIDDFVKTHPNAELATKAEVEKFYTDVLDKLKDKELLTPEKVKAYGTSIDFNKAVDNTLKSINDRSLAPNASMGDKLLYNVGKLCENLGLEKIGKFCMNKIKPENLERLANLETTLVKATKHAAVLGNKAAVESPSGKAGSHVEKLAEQRAGKGADRQI